MKDNCILIATLGSEPQVVTATLDLLLRRGEEVRQVVVVHTAPSLPIIQNAVQALDEAFRQPPYSGRVSLQRVPLQDDEGQPLADVLTPQDGRTVFTTLYTRVLAAKLEGRRVHLSIAGGRKTMSVYGLLSAQLLFDENDRLWHLYSTGDFLESKRLHPLEGDQVSLVAMPIIPLADISPAFTALSQVEDPFLAAERFRTLRLREKLESCRAFVLGSLTAAERRVVSLLVTRGLSDQELGEALFLSPRTVETHLRHAYEKAADHWGMENVSRAQLISLLNWYFTLEER